MADTFVHFEIPADAPDVLVSFYGNIFGWQFQRTPMPGMPGGEYILVQTTEQGKPGMNGGMYKRTGPQDKPTNYIGVASLDDTVAKVTSLGGTVLQPKMAIPGIGWAAIIADPEGNVQGIYQDDTDAK